MKKKILVTATTFPRWKSDTSPRFVYELSDKLSSKYEILVLAPHHKGAKKQETIGKLKVCRFVYFRPERLQKLCYGGGIIPNMKTSFLAKVQVPLLILSEFLAAYKIVKKEKISMLHAHWMLPQGFVGVLLKKMFRVPMVVTVHGSDLFPLKNRLFKGLQKFVVKNSDSITVNSIATRNELIRRFPVYSLKINIIPMGVDTNLFNQKRSQKPKKYSENRILLFVGRLSDQKGLQYLIDSMPAISKYDPKAKLLVIGSGPYEKNLRERAHKNGVEDHVNFLGPLPALDISKYYRFSDIFILPSLSNKTGTEALGLSLLEAMASGCAVIGTNVGGIKFVIKHGHNGLLVKQRNPHDLSRAIITLLKDRDKRGKLGKNAAKFVKKNYSWDMVSKDFMKIYEAILK
ncbi:MAG: glycosyltransferase family 4 protein [Nanoarchaeota archaeon]